MKFKHVFFLIIIAIASIAGAFSVYSHQPQNMQKPVFPKGSSYDKEWKKADSLANKGLNKSALEIVQTIYDKAKTENNASQFVKAIIHRMKFEQSMEEYSLVKALNQLEQETRDTKHPIKPILQSILAECYWQYYENNRWNFYERTQTSSFNNDDITTWDLKTIFNKVIKNYQSSLENADTLKRTPINIYDDVLSVTQPGARKYRPTLYGFLAHRAVDFYMNEEPDMIRPAYKFELDNENVFADAADFIKIKFESNDSLSLKYHAIKTLQGLIAFHVKGNDPKALIDVDLKRLTFVKNKSILQTKEDLYLTALQNMGKQFSTSPASAEINYAIAEFYLEKGNSYNPQESENNKWFKKQALEICDAVIKKYPDSDASINCKVLQAQIKEHTLDFITERINVPNEPFRALITYKNLKTIYVRVAQMDIDKYNKSIDRHYGEPLMKDYLKLSPVKEFSVELPDDGDYQQHSTEIKIPELPLGHYIILVGSEKTFSYKNNVVAYGATWISNISYVNRKMPDGGYDFFVQHRSSGQPLKNVTAQLYYEKYNSILRKYEYHKAEKFISDEKGYFNVPPVEDYRSFSVAFIYEDSNGAIDHLQTDNGIYQYKTYPPDKDKHPKTFFFLDRGIYRPGQTVYFKGIMINTNDETNEIMGNAKTTVTFFDVNHQKISDINLTTNEYGTFTGTFTTPVGVLNGQMSLANESGSTYFSVEEYKRPKFEVLFNPVAGSYKLDEMMKVSGLAKAYSGALIDGAEVKYRVVRTVAFSPLYNTYGRIRVRSDLFQRSEMEITNGVTKSNDTGTFFIDFKAIPDLSLKNWSPIYNYTVYADVTDINGETHSNQTVVKAGSQSLTIDVEIPDKVNKEVKQKFAIKVTNLMGQPEVVEGEMEVLRITEPDKIFRSRLWTKPDKFALKKEEFQLLFANDPYNNEDDYVVWPRGRKLTEQTFKTPNDSLEIEKVKDWKPGLYMLMAYFKDKNGQSVMDIKYFTLYSDKENVVPSHKPNWFVKLKDSGEPGEKAKFLIGSAEKDVTVLYEIEHKEKIVKQEFILLNSEQKIIEIPIEEKHRGNFSVHFTYVKNNRIYKNDAVVTVPYTNKQLDLSFETFRNKLSPGQKEEWKIKIKDKKGEKLAAEMMATLYDASLDAFKPNDWYFNIYNNYYSTLNWDANIGFGTVNAQLFGLDWNIYPTGAYRNYDRLNWFGYDVGYSYGDGNYIRTVGMVAYKSAPQAEDVRSLLEESKKSKKQTERPADADEPKFFRTQTLGESGNSALNVSESKREELETHSKIPVRSNFAETAFFYPQLETDKDGNVVVKFTVPESLTKWKMMGLAHTKDLKYGQIQNELVTQKDLMVVPNAPRFFREGDQMEFSAKISNLSDKELNGSAQIFFYDATTMKELLPSPLGIEGGVRSFSSKKGQSSLVSWNITIPEDIGAITYKVVAKANNFTDGEEMAIPVLTNRMLVTETLPLSVRGNQTKTFRFEKLISQNNGSSTLKNHKLTLEYSSNPAWYAVQALPYLMEYPYECSEQTFSRFYANSIAAHIANSSPKIKAVFDSWRSQSPDALLSNLEKNRELKSLILEETPWVMEAKDEKERKKRIALLFDLNKMSNELSIALQKLQKAQMGNGGWPWFEGMPDDRYITQHIVTGMGHLDHLGIKKIREDEAVWNMISNAVKYLDNRIHEDYEWILKHDKVHIDDNHLSYTQIQYLYARSYFKDIAIDNGDQKAFEYYKTQAKKYWLQNSRYMQGMIALALNRYDDKMTPKDIIKSLKENSINSEEMGMYWKENYEGFYWYQAPVESQALLIEAFDEVANDKKSVDDMKVWLLKSKQTQDWKTTKATTEAVYALLLRGTDSLATESNVEMNVGEQKIDPKKLPDVKVEAGTGYFKTSWSGSDIKPKMGEVIVTKKDAGISWGAMYWQYFEQLDKITPSKTPLNLNKQLFIQKNADAGPAIEPITEKTALKVGDKIKVRIELRVDRDMEYVHMKDMRASGFEPTNVISTYKWQDGLGYYESTRDAATNFFFSYLPKGTYVFEYPLVVTHNGNFSNGITSIQCMYAPEFTSHSEGIRVKVGK